MSLFYGTAKPLLKDHRREYKSGLLRQGVANKSTNSNIGTKKLDKKGWALKIGSCLIEGLLIQISLY